MWGPSALAWKASRAFTGLEGSSRHTDGGGPGRMTGRIHPYSYNYDLRIFSVIV